MLGWLKSIIVLLANSIAGFFQYCFQYVIDLFLSVFNVLGDWFLYLFSLLLDLAKTSFLSLYNGFLVVFRDSVALLVAQFPSLDILNQINYFFPLSEGLGMLLIFLQIWFVLLGVKIILKAIPTVY